MAVFTDGSQYVGKFTRDVMDGQGTYSWAQGHEYKGAFKDGQMDGQGEFNHANGHTMTGLFRRNLYQKVSINLVWHLIFVYCRRNFLSIHSMISSSTRLWLQGSPRSTVRKLPRLLGANKSWKLRKIASLATTKMAMLASINSTIQRKTRPILWRGTRVAWVMTNSATNRWMTWKATCEDLSRLIDDFDSTYIYLLFFSLYLFLLWRRFKHTFKTDLPVMLQV